MYWPHEILFISALVFGHSAGAIVVAVALGLVVAAVGDQEGDL